MAELISSTTGQLYTLESVSAVRATRRNYRQAKRAAGDFKSTISRIIVARMLSCRSFNSCNVCNRLLPRSSQN